MEDIKYNGVRKRKEKTFDQNRRDLHYECLWKKPGKKSKSKQFFAQGFVTKIEAAMGYDAIIHIYGSPDDHHKLNFKELPPEYIEKYVKSLIDPFVKEVSKIKVVGFSRLHLRH